MTEIQIKPIDVNCPICLARKGQSCQVRDGFVEPAHISRQIAAVAALATGEACPRFCRATSPSPSGLHALRCPNYSPEESQEALEQELFGKGFTHRSRYVVARWVAESDWLAQHDAQVAAKAVAEMVELADDWYDHEHHGGAWPVEYGDLGEAIRDRAGQIGGDRG